MKNLKIWSCEMMQNTNELEIVQKLLDNHLFNEKKRTSDFFINTILFWN